MITEELQRQARQFMCAEEKEALQNCCTKQGNNLAVEGTKQEMKMEQIGCSQFSALFEACLSEHTNASKVRDYRTNMRTAMQMQHIKRERSKEMANATRIHFA